MIWMLTYANRLIGIGIMWTLHNWVSIPSLYSYQSKPQLKALFCSWLLASDKLFLIYWTCAYMSKNACSPVAYGLNIKIITLWLQMYVTVERFLPEWFSRCDWHTKLRPIIAVHLPVGSTVLDASTFPDLIRLIFLRLSLIHDISTLMLKRRCIIRTVGFTLLVSLSRDGIIKNRRCL